MKSIHDMTTQPQGFYTDGAKCYELRTSGTTPNGCWAIGARLVEIVDVNIAKGCRVYGDTVKTFSIGEISSSMSAVFSAN